jgi:hypothetical protein
MTLPIWISTELDKIILKYDSKNDEKTLDEIKKLVFTKNPSDRTITWRYSMIKSNLKKIDKFKNILSKVKPSDDLTKNVIESNKKKRDEIKRTIIDKEIINKIMKFEKSNNIYEIYIWLLFISGRRLREIIKSKFYNIKGSQLINMKGVFKKKNNNEENSIKFKTLIPKTRFFKAHKKLMKIYKYSNIKNLSHNLQINIKKKLGKEYKTHNLRGIYVMYAYKFRNNENKKLNSFIMDFLNHDVIESSLSYTNYLINFDIDIIKKKIVN